MTILVDSPKNTINKEGVKKLFQLIDKSIEADKKFFRAMETLRKFVEGDQWRGLKQRKKEPVQMVINLAHAHVRSLLPTLFFQEPTVDAYPPHPRFAGKEQTWNGLLNATLPKIGFKKEVKKVVFDSVVYPEGVFKWVVNKPAQPRQGPGRPSAQGRGGSQSEADRLGPTVWLTKGSPVPIRTSPTQLIVDYLSTDRELDGARFIAIRYKKTLAELRNHPVYGKNVPEDFKAKSVDTPAMGSEHRRRVSKVFDDPDTRNVDADDLITIYEVWIHQLVDEDGDLKFRQQMLTLMEGHNKPIRGLTPWSEIMGDGWDKYPITRLVLNPVPDDLPTAELSVWKQQQVAINWLMSRVVSLVENDRLLYEMDTQKVKNPEKAKDQFYSGRARELVEVEELGAFSIVQPSFVGRDNYTLINLFQSFIQQVSGLGQNRRGGAGIRTATEASIVETGVRIKTEEKVDVVKDFLEEVVVDMAKLVRILVASDKGTNWVFRIGGDPGSVKWLNFTAEDLDWLPEIVIRVDSFRKKDSAEEMQKMGALIQIMLQLVQVYGPAIRADKLFSRMLEAAGIHDAAAFVGDQDAQKTLQMVEISGMMVGVPVRVKREEDHAAHIAIIDAFMNSELGQTVISNSPEVGDVLGAHRQEHLTILEEVQTAAEAAAAAGQNPFATLSSEGPAQGTPASEANTATAQDRTPVQGRPTGGGV